MIKVRIVALGGLVLALCAMAGPRMTHADTVAASGCASGAATTTISSPNMTFTGRTTNAMPVPPAAAAVPPAISIVGTENPPIVVPAPPATSVTTTISGTVEFGLFNYISGIKPVVFPNAVNEFSDYFTFATTVSTVTDTSGVYLASNRTGTFSVYLGHGDFSNVATFSSGTPIMTASFSQHILVPNPVALNPPGLRLTTRPMFSSTATATVTSASPFTYGGTCYQLGAAGKTLTITSVGQFDSPTAIAGNLSGAAIGM
jgi:hypothetical protein